MKNFDKRYSRALMTALAVVTLTACDGATTLTDLTGSTSTVDASADMVAPKSITATAVGAESLSTLVAALQVAELDSVLADESQTFTVFAPINDAFTALGGDTVQSLLADREALTQVLLTHVVGGQLERSTLDGFARESLETVSGNNVVVQTTASGLYINGSRVIGEVAATNGVVYLIDAVIAEGQVPSDQATSNANNAATVTESNTSSNNQSNANSQNNSNASEDSASLQNIVDTAVAAGSFNTLVAAVQAAGLESVLADDSGTFTVFAPTDDAFAALGQNTINALLADPETLKNILLYHVIGGTAVEAKTAVSLAGKKITAANNNEFALSINDGELFVNTSKVVATDVFASNGVIHVIDKVILPPTPTHASGSVVDVAVADGRFTTLVAALQATGLDATLSDHGGIFTVFAPTDSAFEKLGAGTINALLGDLPTLTNILLTHVVSGATIDSVSAMAASGGFVSTASGTDVAISIRNGELFINSSKVIIADIVTENGIIHVIDTVIQ